MERLEMVFEIDGKTIAEEVIKEMNLNVRMEKNKRIANVIAKDLSLKLNKKVDWCVDSDNWLEFHVYTTAYDYKIAKIRILTKEYEEIKEYIKVIKYMLESNMYIEHRASTIEKVIVDMLEENETKDVYILNGLLTNGDLEFCLADIKEYHVYNGEDCLMRIWDELDGWYVINFDNGTIVEELK